MLTLKFKKFSSMLKGALAAVAVGLSFSASAGNIKIQNGQSLVFMGDSLTEYGEMMPWGYTHLVTEGLKANGVTVTWDGVGIRGQQASQMLARFDTDVFANENIGKKTPNVVMIASGANDIGGGVSCDTYIANMMAMADKVRAKGSTPILASPTASSHNESNDDGIATFATSESGALDPCISVFTGDSLATLTEVATDNDSAGGLNARCTFDCVAGETYIICVSSGEYEFDTFKLGWTTSGETLGGYAQWAMEKGLTGDNAAWDAVSGKWGDWPNAFIYTFGDGLLWGTRILGIDIRDGEPVITTAPIEAGHTDFDMKVIGTPNLRNWNSPVILNRTGNDWTLPAGESANFFKVRITE